MDVAARAKVERRRGNPRSLAGDENVPSGDFDVSAAARVESVRIEPAAIGQLEMLRSDGEVAGLHSAAAEARDRRAARDRDAWSGDAGDGEARKIRERGGFDRALVRQLDGSQHLDIRAVADVLRGDGDLGIVHRKLAAADHDAA